MVEITPGAWSKSLSTVQKRLSGSDRINSLSARAVDSRQSEDAADQVFDVRWIVTDDVVWSGLGKIAEKGIGVVQHPHLTDAFQPGATIYFPVVQECADKTTEWTQVMAAAAIGTVPVIIVFIFFQRQLMQGMMGGAIKG